MKGTLSAFGTLVCLGLRRNLSNLARVSVEYHSGLLPLFGNKCTGIELKSMTNLDSSSIPGHLSPNRGGT
jgi:hypothetical protein